MAKLYQVSGMQQTYRFCTHRPLYSTNVGNRVTVRSIYGTCAVLRCSAKRAVKSVVFNTTNCKPIQKKAVWALLLLTCSYDRHYCEAQSTFRNRYLEKHRAHWPRQTRSMRHWAPTTIHANVCMDNDISEFRNPYTGLFAQTQIAAGKVLSNKRCWNPALSCTEDALAAVAHRTNCSLTYRTCEVRSHPDEWSVVLTCNCIPPAGNEWSFRSLALLQPLRWRCVKCVINHERDVREE